MLFNHQQLKQLSDYLLETFRPVFMTKEEGTTIMDKIDHLSQTTDRVAKDISVVKTEMQVANYRIKRLEDWTNPASQVLGLEFKK